MTAFPQTIHFTGLNTPVRTEASVRNLLVEGEIPSEIEGAFFRAVPDPAHPPMFDDDHILSGDGMIARFKFDHGAVDYDIRYVETARYAAEREARRALFGQYRNPFTDDPSVAGVDRTVANTTPLWHAGRLFMTKEDGRAYRVDPTTLDTLGAWDFGGALKSETMTAHSRIDPETGELFFFGYEADGQCSRAIAYGIADRDGNLVREQWFDQPYGGMIHDFAITKSRAIFPIFPTTTDLERLRAGGPKWAHEQDLTCRVGIMPRDGDVAAMRWFEGAAGASAFHIMNAFDEGDRVHLDIFVSDTNAFPFMREAGGIQRGQQEIRGAFERWTFDLTKDGSSYEVRPLGPPGDMPRIRDADTGLPYSFGWYLTVDPNGPPPLPGGPVGMTFNMLIRIDVAHGGLDALALPPGHAISEPVHVPSAAPGHDGWLLAVVDRQVGDQAFASQLWVIDAGAVGAGPVAKVHVPLPLRAQVHGTWVPATQLALAKT
ncbi:carotenoid cleavage dioxygenase [Sphingobium sp. B1D7B]|uniref:carotenoid oxygenase family protein n=1 Tax=unclassified Sphingobium TaxID=2611147 RepID=UPI002224B621|nr:MULTISPECIES: carotenoid oxygenase family protein [unclassified Sphingobium]MCW2392811.1 carotenoid cleavage dioxygenase [Sphingobium sp. B11D3A]MCW2404545.1 carotenoid cleavage dioxygenase [Sphingobium sp. B1D7B]